MLNRHRSIARAFMSPFINTAVPGFLVAATAAAQPQGVTYRVLVAQGSGGGVPQLTSFPADTIMMFDDAHAIVRSNGGGRAFLADGQTVQPIMVSGTPVPGQAGVTWGGQFNFTVRPLTGGGAWFWALANGASQPQALFGGNFNGSNFYMLPVRNSTFGVTPSGMRVGSLNGIAVGRFDEPLTTIVPAGYIPPGRNEPGELSFQGEAGLNSAGAISIGCSNAAARWSDLLVADAHSIRVASRSNEPFQTDRGVAVPTGSGLAASQPVADASVFVRGEIRLNGAAPQYAVWLSRPVGPAHVVFVKGDPAPGAGAGVTFLSTVTPLATNRIGSFLFLATLEGPGVDTSNDTAVYLWRHGRLTLLAREAPGRALPIRGFGEAIALNEQNDVAFVINSRAVLFKPGIGTLEVVRHGAMLPSSTGISYPLVELKPYYGFSGEIYSSGGDDANVSQLTSDGRFFVVGRTEERPSFRGSKFAMTVQITSPGCPADFNNDGFTDFFDYADFVECFEGGRCPDGKTPDFNRDDFDDFFDYESFVTAFETGC